MDVHSRITRAMIRSAKIDRVTGLIRPRGIYSKRLIRETLYVIRLMALDAGIFKKYIQSFDWKSKGDALAVRMALVG